MKINRIEDFKLGWLIGNFEPSLHRTQDFEIGFKTFSAGEKEPDHYQKIATEITLIVSGEAIIGESRVSAGDVIEIPPLEVAGFEAITEVSLVAIKFPSIPSDKVSM